MDRAFENEVYPKLRQFDASLNSMVKRLSEQPAAATATLEIDATKISQGIVEQAKKQFTGIYALTLGLATAFAFFAGVTLCYMAQHWGR